MWEFVAQLQGRPLGILPTIFADSYECNRWEGGNGVGPTTENYVFDLVGAPLGRWNRAFVDVGVKAFIDAGKANTTLQPDLAAIFFEHFKRLREDCKAHKRSMETEGNEITQAKKNTATRRKSERKNKEAVSQSGNLSLLF